MFDNFLSDLQLFVSAQMALFPNKETKAQLIHLLLKYQEILWFYLFQNPQVTVLLHTQYPEPKAPEHWENLTIDTVELRVIDIDTCG